MDNKVKTIAYERKWVSGRDRLLDYLHSQLEKGGSWDFRIEEDDVISDGYYVTSTPIVAEKPMETIWCGPAYEASVVADGCFQIGPEACQVWQLWEQKGAED